MAFRRTRVFRDSEHGVDKIVIHSVQDVETIKEVNRITRLANGSGTSSLWQKREWVKVASVPLAWLDQLWQQGIRWNDPNAWPVIKRMLNSNEYEELRTAPGRF